METITIKAEPRQWRGTKQARRHRENGLLPGVIYGHGGDTVSITLPTHEVELAITHGARMVEVDVNGKAESCLIKEVQYDHLGIEMIHVDLNRVSLTERVQVNVGIELRGTPRGVGEGGVLDQHMAEIEVECLVTKIPDTFHPLVTELGVGDSLLVRDLEVPEGVTLLADPEDRICSIHEKREAPPEEEEAVEEEEEGAEPEVIGRKKEEEEEQAGE